MDRSDTKPSGLADALASDAPGLVVHAPGVTVAGRFPDDVTEQTTLPSDPDGPTAVLDFYDAWQTADAAAREAFRACLDGDAAIHLAATPREFDWLLAEGALSTDSLSAVSQAVRVRFDPDGDLAAAVNVALEADGTLDRETVRSAFGDGGEPDSRYVYEGYETERYESRWVANAVGDYEPTLVPRAVTTVPPTADDTNVSGLLESMGSKIGLAEFWGATKELVVGLGQAAGVTAAAGAAGPAAPLVAAVGLTAFLRLSDWGDGAAEERLLPRAFAPHERARFETAMQLPPRTIARLRSLGAGELPDSVTDDLVDSEEFAELVERHESELEGVRRFVDDLRGWRRARLIGATDPLDDLAARLENEESNVLGETVSFEDIPYEEQSDVDDDRPDDRQKAVKQAVRDSELVVLSGPHGTGKTTTAYRAFRELAQEYEIRLGRFAYDSAAEVKEALEAISGETLLFLQYRSGEYTIQDDRHLEDVLRFLDDGVCSRVVIETRSEDSDELDEAVPTQGSSARHALWEGRETVAFSKFDTEAASIRTVAEWALDTVGYEGDAEAREETVEDVLRLAEGSPEIAKIAARFAAREGRSLAEIDTRDELIWQDVRAGLNTNRDTQERRALHRLAAFGRVTTAELREMVDRPTEVIDTLEGYLAGSVTDDGVSDPSEEEWRLSPSIYGRVLFQRFVFEGEADSRLFERLLRDARDGADDLFSRLAGTVGNVFETAAESGDRQLRHDTWDRAGTLVERADEWTEDNEAYFVVVRRLLFTGVRLTADSLNVVRLVNGAPREAAEFSVDSPTILMNLCGWLLSNSLRQGVESSGVTDLGIRMAAEQGTDKEAFLENSYAMAVNNLVDNHGAGDDSVDRWIEWMNKNRREAADEIDVRTTHLMAGALRIALRQMAVNHRVDSTRPWLIRLEVTLHRDTPLGAEIREHYMAFVSSFGEKSLPRRRLHQWSQFLWDLYFRVIGYGVPSSRFRHSARAAHGRALLAHTEYASALYEFDAGRLSHDELARMSTTFLNEMSELSDEAAQIAIALVAHELRHVDADLHKVLPAVRQHLRSEHENGEMAGRWRAHFAGEWPEPVIPRYPTTEPDTARTPVGDPLSPPDL